MSNPSITDALHRFAAGDREAGNELIAVIGMELRRIASQRLSKERRNHTLQTTALLNEAFLRLVHAPKGGWNDRNHFMAVASRVMRQVLVDYARARGPEPAAVNVEIEELESRPVSSSVLDIDHALQELAVIAPRQVELVELRFFGGLTLEEAATALGVSPRTADKDWALARAWLRRRLATGFTEETPQ